MQIRRRQMAVFEDVARQQFEAEMLDHTHNFAPELSVITGDTNLRSIITAAVDRSYAYGFTDRGPVRLFLEMILSFGWGFDSDPLLTWAASALVGTSDQHRRAARLYAASHDYFCLVAGLDDAFTVAALRRAGQLPPNILENAGCAINDRIEDLLKSVYPEKYIYCGKLAVAEFLRAAAQTANRYRVVDDLGRAIMASAMFSFGHQVFSDPLYPWAATCLESSASSEERTGILQHRLIVYFRRMIVVLERPA